MHNISIDVFLCQVTVYFGLGTAVSFAGMAVASLSIWALVAVLPSLVTSTVLVQTISTAELTKARPVSCVSCLCCLASCRAMLACLELGWDCPSKCSDSVIASQILIGMH